MARGNLFPTRPIRGLLALALWVVLARESRAQPAVSIPGTCDTGVNRNADCRMNLTISTNIVATRRLVVTPGATFALTPASGQLSAADLDAGAFDASGSLRVQVQSNAPYRVTVQAAGAVLTGACSSKASSTILWGTSPSARTTPSTVTPTIVFSGTTFTAGEARDLYFRIGVGWLTDGPVAAANCTLPLTFSVSAP